MMKHPYVDSERYVVRFQDQSVVDRYHLRPAYPPQTFVFLSNLMKDEPRAVLDVGCGTGNVTRPLADYVDRIDALDRSLPMLERAKALPGGASPKIRWLHGRAEDAPVEPPYAMITAGESLHWMDWGTVLPRFARLLTPNGVLAVLYIVDQPVPWQKGYRRIVRRFTNNPSYQPINWIAALVKAHLFHKLGQTETAPLPIQQAVVDYIAGQHARSGLSLDTMTAEQAEQFDTEMHSLLLPFAQNGLLTLSVVGGITWGKPLPGVH